MVPSDLNRFLDEYGDTAIHLHVPSENVGTSYHHAPQPVVPVQHAWINKLPVYSTRPLPVSEREEDGFAFQDETFEVSSPDQGKASNPSATDDRVLQQGAKDSSRRSCFRCDAVKLKCTPSAYSRGCQQCYARGLECPVNSTQNPIQGIPDALQWLYLKDEPPALPEEARIASLRESPIISPGKFLPRACTRCRKLKIKCVYDTGAESCQRCLRGGCECMVPIRKTMRVRQLNLEGEPSTLQEETKVGLETSPYESRTISSGKSQESQTGLEVSPHESLTISPSKFLAGACIRCKMLKVKCSHDAGAESCRRCLLGGFKCVVPDRKKRISEGIQPDTFSLPSSLGEPDIKTGYFGDFSEKLAVPNRGLANDKTSEPFQTGRDPKVQSQAFPTPADDLLVNLDENALWFESDRYITADEAFAFVSDLEIPLRIAFADVKFRGQYKIQVGFDESMLRQGMLVEEVYLLLDVGLQVPVHDVCNTFTAIFAPFPAIVYTPEQTYYLPVDPQEQSGRGMKALGEFRTRGRGSGSSGNRPGTGVAHSGKGSSNDGTNRRGNRSDRDRGIEKDHKGARESEGEEDGDEDDDDKPNPGGGKTESRSLGKRARRGAQIVNIPFGSTLSIAGIDGSHRVNTVASVDIMIDKNEHGTSPPPDSRWSGPWFGVDMTGLEVSSIFVDRPAYLLSLAQVQVMACSPEPVVLLDRSPQHLHTEGDSVKHTVTRNAGFSLGAMLSASPSVQAQYSAGEASGTEKRMRRWDVGSYKILDETQLEGESDGAVWKYIHNDAIFGRVEGWSFDHELRPSAVFGFSDVKPEVEVQVVAFWSSEAHTKLMKPRDSFPFRWRRAKEQQSVFANFVYQVAVVVDLEKVQDERSWIMPRKQLDSVKRNELSGTKGPIHFNPITAMAKMHSEGQMEEVVSAGWDVSITRGVDERPGLTAPERTGAVHLTLQPPTGVLGHSSLPTPTPSPSPSPPPTGMREKKGLRSQVRFR